MPERGIEGYEYDVMELLVDVSMAQNIAGELAKIHARISACRQKLGIPNNVNISFDREKKVIKWEDNEPDHQPAGS